LELSVAQLEMDKAAAQMTADMAGGGGGGRGGGRGGGVNGGGGWLQISIVVDDGNIDELQRLCAMLSRGRFNEPVTLVFHLNANQPQVRAHGSWPLATD
jgi:hypothetical protein